MLPTPADPAVLVAADLEAGAVLVAGPTVFSEAEVAGLMLIAHAAVPPARTAIEVLAVLGVLVWAVALLVLVAGGALRAAHRLGDRPLHGDSPRWNRRGHFGEGR